MAETPTYERIHQFRPGQIRYSRLNVDRKFEKLRRKRHIFKLFRRWFPIFDWFRSAYKNRTVRYVETRIGRILVDGHHTIQASLRANATTVPAESVGDFTHVPEGQIWDVLEEEGLVHLTDLEGNRRIPSERFEDLENDSTRYFASAVKRHIEEGGTIEDSSGAEYPVWIKCGKDVPFIEFKISDHLRKHGLTYDESHGFEPPQHLVEESRRILVAHPIPGLRVVPERTHYKDIKVDCP